MEQMQCYIKYARAIKPRITPQVRTRQVLAGSSLAPSRLG
jgi:hypothetical protein